MTNYQKSEQIKSKERVKELAEVYTAKKQVCEMLELCSPFADDIYATFLEPACGNGNFLEEILLRKLKNINTLNKEIVKVEYETLIALSCIYGVDISNENIEEARLRLKTNLLSYISYELNTKHHTKDYIGAIDFILSKNLIVGDTINEPGKIIFTNFLSVSELSFTMSNYSLKDMIEGKEIKLGEEVTKKYFDLS